MRIRGSGPVPSQVVIITDYPGKEEDRIGLPLVGKTGQEVNRFLGEDGIPARSDIHIEPLIREWRPDGDYPQADIDRDGPELVAALAEVRPSTIITLGRNSARFFLGDVDLEDVHSLVWKVDPYWGRPRNAKGISRDIALVPIYNPAAGFRNPDMSAKVSYGFSQVAAYFRGELQAKLLHDDPYRGREHYVEITDEAEIQIDPTLPIAIDSEGWARRPWGVQYSQVAGTGYLIRANRVDLLAKFGRELRATKVRIVFHSALHDLSVLRAVGIETSDLLFDDTQVMAYLLQVEPLGLKPLSARHAGMVMQSYDDLLGDAGNELARDYLVSIYDTEQADYEIKQSEELARLNATPLFDKDGQPKRLKATGEIRYRKIAKAPSLPKSGLHKAAERLLRSKRPRSLWEDQDDDIHVAAYNRLGNMDEPTLDHVDGGSSLYYAGRDPDATGRLASELNTRVDSLELRGVYNLEIGTYPLIDRMGAVGLKPDLDHFHTLSGKLQREIDRLQTELNAQTSQEAFNANSGDQVRKLLFDDLGMPCSKRTSKGECSTNDKILEGLEREYGTRVPVVSTIREFREQYKLKNTFVDRIPDFVARWPNDGRIHSTFRTTRVVTGRLAASDPNVLAMPKHGAFAPEFRAGFVEDEGWALASWDQSQIELRILAHLSQDPYMLAVFRGEIKDKNGNPVDLHSVMGERIFGVPPHLQDESKHRLPSKAVNFGLPMGMTRYGLAIELRKNGLNVDEDDAQRWIEAADELYVGVPAYKRAKIEEAKRNGLVRCMSGRIRYIGGIRSWDEFVREEAERFAFSTPIQEGAQTVMKTAEYHVWNDIVVPWKKQGRNIDPLIQIHDDLLMRVDETLVRELNTSMQWAMTQTYKGLSVPLATDGVYGWNWAKQKFNPRGMRKF